MLSQLLNISSSPFNTSHKTSLIIQQFKDVSQLSPNTPIFMFTSKRTRTDVLGHNHSSAQRYQAIVTTENPEQRSALHMHCDSCEVRFHVEQLAKITNTQEVFSLCLRVAFWDCSATSNSAHLCSILFYFP